MKKEDRLFNSIEILSDMLVMHGLSDTKMIALHDGRDALIKQISKHIKFDDDDLNVCPVCGTYAIETDDKFCRECGNAIYCDNNYEDDDMLEDD